MKFLVDRYVPCIAAPLALLCGCAASVPSGTAAQAPMQSRATQSPAAARAGVYVALADPGASILGYNRKYKRVCSLNGAGYASGIAADTSGNLLAPEAGSNSIVIYRGPQLCGPQYGSIGDPYGQPTAVSSRDALNGKIVVANSFDAGGRPGSISVCTLSGGCNGNFTNPNMYEVAGVAIARNGDCWADATDPSGTATLTYFRRCSGLGKSATGFVNQYYGSLQIDRQGNLVTTDSFNSRIYVYEGCNPHCSPVGGPFALRGAAFFVSLNARSTMLAAADYANSAIDVYRYSPTGLTYRFSFEPDSGSPSGFINGVAYTPGR